MGDDTDPLVLVIQLADGNKHNVYFRLEPKKGAAVRRTGVNLIRHKVDEHRLIVIGKAAGLKLVKANETKRS